MAAGLRVWDAAGRLTFDTNDYVGRYLGYVWAGLGAGSVTDSRLQGGIPFAVPVMVQTNNTEYPILNYGPYTTTPVISFSGATMNFSRTADGSPGEQVPGCIIWYGVR